MKISFILDAVLWWRTRQRVEAELALQLEQARQDREQEACLVRELLLAVARTNGGIVPQLRALRNQAIAQKSPMEGALNRMFVRFKRDMANNCAQALLGAAVPLLDAACRAALSMLNTPQEKAILILTEMDYSVAEVSQILGNSSGVVRSTKSYIRKKLSESPFPPGLSTDSLKIMQKDPIYA